VPNAALYPDCCLPVCALHGTRGGSAFRRQAALSQLGLTIRAKSEPRSQNSTLPLFQNEITARGWFDLTISFYHLQLSCPRPHTCPKVGMNMWIILLIVQVLVTVFALAREGKDERYNEEKMGYRS